ncbi:uncharacterized protein RCO7_06432 [Rhynchosporium graminicola]|uniref:Uncharacterized protein n=1 Tax=Rhynchosporium graminicola TaxID=2792576 RepID=A0A1E1KL86_9HELO|nr:uncharacterized protein RCO7_06432 [Rhynchosporium commune]
MSLLEKLPMELLELVFQFCLNLDLPKASPVLAGKLASITVYNWTIMRAFGPSWERGFARHQVIGEKDHEDDGVREEVEEEDAELQSAVLRCRWASLEVMLRAKEVWIQKYADDRQFEPLYFLKEKNTTASPPLPDSNSDSDSAPQDVGNTSPTDTESLLLAPATTPRLTPSQYLETDYADFLSFTSSSPDGPWPWHTICWSSYTDLSPTLEIPHSLLSPPFTPSSLKYLFHLLRHGARISWLSSTSGEVALSGLRAAVKECNIQAVHLLVWSGLLETLDGEMLIWVLRNAGVGGGRGEEEGKNLKVDERFRTVNQILRLGYTVLGVKERGMIEIELSDMRDEALMAGDDEGVEFVRRIVESETLRGRIDVRL